MPFKKFCWWRQLPYSYLLWLFIQWVRKGPQLRANTSHLIFISAASRWHREALEMMAPFDFGTLGSSASVFTCFNRKSERADDSDVPARLIHYGGTPNTPWRFPWENQKLRRLKSGERKFTNQKKCGLSEYHFSVFLNTFCLKCNKMHYARSVGPPKEDENFSNHNTKSRYIKKSNYSRLKVFGSETHILTHIRKCLFCRRLLVRVWDWKCDTVMETIKAILERGKCDEQCDFVILHLGSTFMSQPCVCWSKQLVK